ncbi:MAG: DpnII family type II restriction endonuclease [Spirochaetales bacterium]|nr:DpnII family type II restriction endonuclease [Spirochaetales bacterium]
MEKIKQDKDALLANLSVLETDWRDEFSTDVISFLDNIDVDSIADNENRIQELLEDDFNVASTVFRLFLEKSKDEYTSTLKELFPEKGKSGSSGFRKDPEKYTKTLNHLFLREKMIETIDREYTWKDIITERLKAGRGSAIKGQKRGRQLEDFVENIVKQVFDKYEPRCSFIGMKGNSTEKADFAIPSKENPEIIIEVKGYGATGSKQTDVIGDVNRIIQEKRHDSTFLLFTDGITWKERESDFRKLIEFQNQGYIYKLYTKSMEEEFLNDLKLLKAEKNI